MKILNPKTGAPFEAPTHVQENLDRAKEAAWSAPMGSAVGWRDVLTPRRVLSADGAQVLNTLSETIMCPDYTFAADSMEVGDAFKYTLFGSMSTIITTPTTVTLRLRWGGVGGTLLAASGAFAPDPTAASTTVSYCTEWYVVCRSVGATGSLLAFGKIVWNDFDDASATTLKGNLDMQMAPVSVPAAVTVNTTAASALSPTVQLGTVTATTQLTNMIALLESLN
jgi:hypothetical protein